MYTNLTVAGLVLSVGVDVAGANDLFRGLPNFPLEEIEMIWKKHNEVVSDHIYNLVPAYDIADAQELYRYQISS